MAVMTCCRETRVAKNREEGIHGSQGKEVEIEKEGQEGCGEKEDRCEALRAEAQIRREEKEGCAKEGSEEEIGAEEARRTCTRSGATGRTRS
jgi:hypothetical protein